MGSKWLDLDLDLEELVNESTKEVKIRIKNLAKLAS